MVPLSSARLSPAAEARVYLPHSARESRSLALFLSLSPPPSRCAPCATNKAQLDRLVLLFEEGLFLLVRKGIL